MAAAFDDPSLPPRYLLEVYRQTYLRVYNAEPDCCYIGDHWYTVNGETVHRATLMDEIARLHETARREPQVPADKSVIHRVIAKIRRF